jgi:hypothetical protein
VTGSLDRTAHRSSGLPVDRDLWALGVLPVLAAGTLAGLLGIYWDIAWHIDRGRDRFFTPPHDFIYASMTIVLLTSLYALWGDRRKTSVHFRFGPCQLHSGVLIVAVGAALVLAFAPLDDLWHRLFGKDITLWGPMHLIGLLGLTLASFGGLVSARLERRMTGSARRAALFDGAAVFFAAGLLGWMVLVLAEYEFNLPQFPPVFHPILLVGLPGFVLVLASRTIARPWGATAVTLVFTILRLAIAGWLITASHLDLAGFTRPLIPLLVPSGVAVDLAVMRGAPGWGAGLAGGMVTLAANLAVVSLGDGIRWTWVTILTALPPGILLAVLAGWAGEWAARALSPSEPHPRG